MMTTAVARWVKACFTTRMATPTAPSRSETIYEKAERIIGDPSRVRERTSDGTNYWTGDVVGDHGTYGVVSIGSAYAAERGLSGPKVACNCRAGRRVRLCSHMIVAEEMRIRGEDA